MTLGSLDFLYTPSTDVAGDLLRGVPRVAGRRNILKFAGLAASVALGIVGGGLYLAGGVIMCYNLWATVARQPRTASTVVAVPAE